jgi:hypothetical protein
MNINFTTPRDISFDMIPFITKVNQDFPKRIMGVASSPAVDHLVTIRAPSDAVSSQNPRQLLIIIPLLNSYFCLAFAVTSKQQLLF